MRKKTKLLLALSFAVLPAISSASDWQYVAGAGEKFFYMDFDSVAQVGINTKVWVRADYLKPQETDSYPKKSYQASKLLYYFDCKAKMLGVVQRVSYEKMAAEGEVVESHSKKFDPKMLDDVVPESIGEGLMDAACAGPAGRAKIKAKNRAASQEYLHRVQELWKKQQDEAAQGGAPDKS